MTALDTGFPACAGNDGAAYWIPAFAGMTALDTGFPGPAFAMPMDGQASRGMTALENGSSPN